MKYILNHQTMITIGLIILNLRVFFFYNIRILAISYNIRVENWDFFRVRSNNIIRVIFQMDSMSSEFNIYNVRTDR